MIALESPQTFALLDQRGLPIASASGASPLQKIRSVGIFHDALRDDAQLDIDLESAIASACRVLRDLDLTPVVDHQQRSTGLYAGRWHGTPHERSQHLHRLIEDHGVDAVWLLFGKGGASSVIDCLHASDYLPTRPVDLIGGFSQQTDWALFAKHHGRRFFQHVLNANQLAYLSALPQSQVANLRTVLKIGAELRFPGLKCFGTQPTHTIGGDIIGGNLGVILASLGKAWMPSLSGCIVYIEDFDKPAHEVHRQLDSLAHHAVCQGASALLIGSIIAPRPEALARLDTEARRQRIATDGEEIRTICDEIAQRVTVPIFYKFGCWGHGAVNLPLFLNAPCRIAPAAEGTYTLINYGGPQL
jgi:muramoyltetrapeptide carboxypeptidase LdcA involved in peptidoglycan recycling